MTWVLYFSILLCNSCGSPQLIHSHVVLDALSCRRMELGVAARLTVLIDTDTYGEQLLIGAKCKRMEVIG
jgi:hypothetical protein